MTIEGAKRDVLSRVSVASCTECEFVASGNTAIACGATHARTSAHDVHATYTAAYVYRAPPR